jgi:hypothetical protein
MASQPWAIATLAAACVLTLGACSKHADSNANAPGSPGTGNATETVRPAAPDGPPGGPSGIAGSAPHTGSSGGDAPVGTTGSGTTDASGRTQTVQPGAGLNGGLGGSNSVMGSSPGGTGTSAPTGTGPGSSAAGSGSPNSTSGNAYGSRL